MGKNRRPTTRRHHWLARGFWWLLGVLVGLPALAILALRWIPPPTSAFMLGWHLEHSLHRPAVRAKLYYRWVPWEQISPFAPLAVIAAEDQKFPDHWGFDFTAIGAALDHNQRGGRLRGASTISQQVAKNLFLWSGRSFIRKGLEAYLTLLIETLWPKQRILEVYLNVVEFGDGVYGVGAAAEQFFATTPARLSPTEAARLAAVLPNPKVLSAAHPSAYVWQRVRWISGQMNQLGGTAYLKKL